MSNSDLVRFSRDGDQFHYRWAARRCLRLLRPRTDLAAVTIEGVSVKESDGGAPVAVGEETVDVAEYYGSQKFEFAHRVDYIQLKHSTARTSRPWTISELSGTLEAFANRYQALRQRYGAAEADKRLTFKVTSNRQFSERVLKSVADLASNTPPRHKQVAAELQRWVRLPKALIGKFFERLKLDGGEAGFREQADRLNIEANALLAGTDLDAALRLKDLVTRKATSEGLRDNAIIYEDVLLALRVSPDDFFPAPSRLECDPDTIPRKQESEIAIAISTAMVPVLVSATGGVGKSILATRLGPLMPPGSVTIVYDCFGNGEYRQLAHARHPHRIALVQIANELSALGLSQPLLPTSGGGPREYMRAFITRLDEAVSTLRDQSPTALIIIIVDAADNAQMAADEAGGPHAFVRDLIREILPDGIRLAMLFRPERESLLNPPPSVVRVQLESFTIAESTAHLRCKYPTATDPEVLEFHRLSSANPRVQANAIAAQPSLLAVLESLGPYAKSVDDQIAEQLRSALVKVKDDAGRCAGDIDVLCAALAALRPLVPIKTLAEMSRLSADAIRSFVTDFAGGRPLLITGEYVQFRDEPVESWFRQTYRADKDQLKAFVERLKPLAERDIYAAGCLPSLMLACDDLAELIEMALSRARLPTDSPLARRQIEVERLQFAFRASLRAQRWADAAKLSMKAGEEAAGAERHDSLIRANSDLIAKTFEAERLQDLIARQVFLSGGWLGRRYVREAVVLSSAPELRGEALGKLRMAESWLDAWGRLPSDQRYQQHIDDDDRANLALAHLNLHGAAVACAELTRWVPDRLWYESCLILAKTLVDHGRFTELDELVDVAAMRKAAPIVGAVAVALAEVNRTLTAESAKALLSAKVPRIRRLATVEPPWLCNPNESAMIQAVVAALQDKEVDRQKLARKLTRLLPKDPPRWIASRDGQRKQYLRAISLRAALRGEDLLLESVAPEEIRRHLSGSGHNNAPDVREFKTRVGGLLPWWKLWAKAKVARLADAPLDLASEILDARKGIEPSSFYYDSDRADFQDEAAEIWFDLICEAGPDGVLLIADFERWVAKLKQPLYVTTWAVIARKAARNPCLQGKAHQYARRIAVNEWGYAAENVDSRIETLVSAARAIFCIDHAEASEYLNSAIEVATRLGDDVFDRWAGVLALADRGAEPTLEQPELAYRLSRSAELCAEYVDRHFDWADTISCIAGLAPSSAVVIVSRWRDREVGWFNDLLVNLVDTLTKLGRLDPVLACALVGFRFDWATIDLLKRALEATSDVALKQALFDLMVRYKSLDCNDAKIWRGFVELGRNHRLDTVDAERAVGRARKDVETPSKASKPFRHRKVDWGKRLAKWPIRGVFDALHAYHSLREDRRSFDSKQFWSTVFLRVSTASTPVFIETLLNTPSLDIFDLQDFLQAIPAELRQRLAIQSAMKRGMERAARRLCWSLHIYRRDVGFPIFKLAELSGCSERTIIEQVLAGVADDIEPAGSADLFRLTPLLAALLDPSDAQNALNHALSLIEPSIEDGTGDGPWTPKLAPNSSTDEAMAGLIWGALGALREDVRWQAAHVVRALARLGKQDTIARLVWHAEHGVGSAASPNLPFYELDALQWFVVALARASRESPDVMLDQTAFLRELARRDYPHLMIRYYAADALLALDRVGVIRISQSECEGYEKINKSHLEPRLISYGEGPHVNKYAPRDGGRDYLFDHDIEDKLMEGLANAFLITMPDLERMATHVIRTDWALDANGHWDREPRRSQPTLAHRSGERTSPVSSYSAYLSYHATMTVAAALLKGHPPRKYKGKQDNEFATWFGYQKLTRSDGGWIFDRRDATPSLPVRLPEASDDIWRWAVSNADFDRALGRGSSQLVIWGAWTEVTSAGSERIRVHSTLVDRETSRAYLAGAQTANHPWDFNSQSEKQQDEADKPPFVARAWVRNDNAEPHLDRSDPWAAQMQYPPPTPATNVRTLLGLQSAFDGRQWIRPGRGNPVFVSEGWATAATGNDEDGRVEGDRLLIIRRMVPGVLAKLKMDVIVGIEIQRAISRGRRARDAEIFEEHPLPYFRFYLIHHDNTIETLS